MRNMTYRENIPLDTHTTFRLGGVARYFAELVEPEDIESVYKTAKKLAMPVTILGSGSNTFFTDGVIERFFVKNQIAGRQIIDDNQSGVLASVGAGENWDELVAWTVDQGLSGLEVLSGIPGTVGAAPVQNIGAYGLQLSEVLDHVVVWDKKEEISRVLTRDECVFSYRDSLFKRQSGQWVVLSVTLRLSREQRPVPEYKTLTQHLAVNNIKNPDVVQVRAAVLAVRRSRLPDITESPNLGSFFMNPVVAKRQADELAEQFPEIVRFNLPDGRVKIPAGWLIEEAGLKGSQFGNFRTSADNALVLIHDGKGTTAELLEVEKRIRKKVKGMFGIRLEREPNLIS